MSEWTAEHCRHTDIGEFPIFKDEKIVFAGERRERVHEIDIKITDDVNMRFNHADVRTNSIDELEESVRVGEVD